MPLHMTSRGVHLTIDPTTTSANVLAMYGDVLARVEKGEHGNSTDGGTLWHVTLPNGEALDGSPFVDWKVIPQLVEDFWGPDEVCKQK